MIGQSYLKTIWERHEAQLEELRNAPPDPTAEMGEDDLEDGDFEDPDEPADRPESGEDTP